MAEKTQASKGASGDDAIALLTDDHKKVKKMFSGETARARDFRLLRRPRRYSARHDARYSMCDSVQSIPAVGQILRYAVARRIV